MEVNPRTQAARSAATRGALVAAARPLFAEHGFAGVGTETIVRAAGVSRGALYHQFADKTELFAAVAEAVEQELTQQLADAMAAADVADQVAALAVGATAWLDASTDPQYRQILLVDGPAVLGWERWHEIGMRYGIGLLEGLLQQAMDVGLIPPQSASALAHILIGALDEAALYIARANDPATARTDVQLVVTRLLAGLVPDP